MKKNNEITVYLESLKNSLKKSRRQKKISSFSGASGEGLSGSFSDLHGYRFKGQMNEKSLMAALMRGALSGNVRYSFI